MVTLRKLITNNYNLAISSTFIGFCFWYFLGSMRQIEIHLNVPLSFYGEQLEKYLLDAPESITIFLKGFRKDFYNLQLKSLAIHHNADALHLGANTLSVSAKDLFLPDEIKLVNYKPSNIVVVVKNNNTN